MFRKKSVKIIAILIAIATIVALCFIGYAGIQNNLSTKDAVYCENEVEEIKLIEIGELHTTKMNCTGSIEYGDRKKGLISNKELEFTKNSIKYHYNVNIEAGYKLSDIKQTVEDDYVLIKLPKANIYNPTINTNDSFFYDERDNVFNKITTDDYNNAQEKALDKAVKLHKKELMKQAKESAKREITNLYSNAGIKVKFI